MLGSDDWRTVGQADFKFVHGVGLAGRLRDYLDDRRRHRRRAAGRDRFLEAGQAGDDRAPFGNLPVRRDEIGQGTLHAVERGGGLHQAAKLHGAREVGGCDDDIGKNYRSLRVALREEGELLLPLHQRIPIADDRAEAGQVLLAFRRFAFERSDLFGVFARAHQIKAEVGFEALLQEIQCNERPTY